MPDSTTSEALQKAKDSVRRLIAALSPDQLDRIVDRVALETESSVKQATPKRWFGQLRNGWTTSTPESGIRIVSNPLKAANGVQVMLFVEFGTASGGSGFIYPTKARKLYIPLTRRAALGWNPSLKYGTDYILRPRVRGMKPQGIVQTEREKIPARMDAATKEMLVSVLKTEGFV